MQWALITLPSVLVVCALLLLERRGGRGFGDWLINLQCFAISTFGAFTVHAWLKPWQLFSVVDGSTLPPLLAVLLCIAVQDLGENLYHRLQHRVPFLWEMHSLHHSDPDMGALTTVRHFWADHLIKTITIWSLAGMIISPTPLAAISYLVLSQWNFVAHANLDWNFGKWSWVINSPAYHRRHHSSDPRHYDSNFAALFPLYDLLLGGYNVPDGRPATGLERRPRTMFDLLIWPFAGKRRQAVPQGEVAA